jgi:bifunctional non-homologous end joining protein LigD
VADKLETYRRKRRAGATPEPLPDDVARATSAEGPSLRGPEDETTHRRFVVQEHHATRLHWDLRLEREGVLVSFAVPNALPVAPGVNRLALWYEDKSLV